MQKLRLPVDHRRDALAALVAEVSCVDTRKAVDNAVRGFGHRSTLLRMTEPVHDLPEEIVLEREEYRLQHAALEAALDVLDRVPGSDPDDVARHQIEIALQLLLRRIWPYLDELDEQD